MSFCGDQLAFFSSYSLAALSGNNSDYYEFIIINQNKIQYVFVMY